MEGGTIARLEGTTRSTQRLEGTTRSTQRLEGSGK